MIKEQWRARPRCYELCEVERGSRNFVSESRDQDQRGAGVILGQTWQIDAEPGFDLGSDLVKTLSFRTISKAEGWILKHAGANLRNSSFCLGSYSD